MHKRNWKIQDEQTIFEMMRLWTNLDPIFDQINKDQTRSFDMTVANDQWLREWKEAYERKGRPVTSYNLLRQVINVINAVELSNRKRIIAKPTGDGDAELAETVTEVLLHFFHRTEFDWHRTKVFNNSIIAKFGVYHLSWSFENDPMGELEIDDCDPRTLRFEPNYSDPSWQKSGYILRKHSLSLEEILNKFALNDLELQEAIINEARMFFDYSPDKRNKFLSTKLKHLFTAVYESATGSNPNSSNSPHKYFDWFDPLTGKFEVLELHEKRTERILLVHDSRRKKDMDITNLVKEKDGIRFNNELIEQVKHKYGLDGEPRTNLKDSKYVVAVIPAFRLKVNEQPYPFQIKGYVYVPQYCYDYHADIMKSQSVIDDLIDPQSAYNKAQSLKLELLWRYANNGWILDANAIDGYEEDWESGRMAPFRRVRPGYIQMIKPEQQQHISPDLINETKELPGVIELISNAGASIRGRQEPNEKSGKHFIAKKTQEEKSFSYLFNNVDGAARAVAESSWGIIQYNVTIPRLFRITHDQNIEPQNLMVNERQLMKDPETGMLIEKIKNDISIGKYDFVMDKTPYSGNAKEIEFAKLSELFEAVAEINPERANAMLPILVEAGGFPFAQKILEAWQQTEGPSPEEQQMQQLMMQVQQIMAKLGIEEKKAEVTGLQLDNEKKAQELRTITNQNNLGMWRDNDADGKIKTKKKANVKQTAKSMN